MSLPGGPERSSVGCVCLVVTDGWGIAPPGPGNAVVLARTPLADELWDTYPYAELSASGASVGLPDRQMGNSEVGQLTPTAVGSKVRTRASDTVLCFNFRPHRMRQIVRALAEPGFGEGTEALPGWRGRDGASAVRRRRR